MITFFNSTPSSKDFTISLAMLIGSKTVTTLRAIDIISSTNSHGNLDNKNLNEQDNKKTENQPIEENKEKADNIIFLFQNLALTYSLFKNTNQFIPLGIKTIIFIFISLYFKGFISIKKTSIKSKFS